MSDVIASISRLVEIARRLRSAADELGQIDLKSQIVDEISTLQEIRDVIADDSHLTETEIPAAIVAAAQSLEAVPPSSTATVAPLDDASMGILKPSGNEKTYSLMPEKEAPETGAAETGAAETGAAETGAADAGATATNGSDAGSPPGAPNRPTLDER